jgi:hypothetical protein
MRILVLAAALLLSTVASAQTTIDLTIVVNTSEPVRLDTPVSVGKCDDESIVKVKDGGDSILLEGLKAGTTLCGFWTQGGNHHTLVTVTVVEEAPDAGSAAAPPSPGTVRGDETADPGPNDAGVAPKPSRDAERKHREK